MAFPSACPFFTSVGAAQVNPGRTVKDPKSACMTEIYSGGVCHHSRFASSSHAGPITLPCRLARKYPLDHGDYWRNHKPSYEADKFNNSMNIRGIPVNCFLNVFDNRGSLISSRTCQPTERIMASQ